MALACRTHCVWLRVCVRRTHCVCVCVRARLFLCSMDCVRVCAGLPPQETTFEGEVDFVVGCRVCLELCLGGNVLGRA